MVNNKFFLLWMSVIITFAIVVYIIVYLIFGKHNNSEKYKNPKSKIVYINMDKNPERNEHMISEFKNHNITNYERFKGIDGKAPITEKDKSLFKKNSLTPGEIGCFLSHYYVWKKLIDSDYDYFVVSEDDSVFANDIEKGLRDVENFIKTNPNINYIINLSHEFEDKNYKFYNMKSE